jgi:hypothetical protein
MQRTLRAGVLEVLRRDGSTLQMPIGREVLPVVRWLCGLNRTWCLEEATAACPNVDCRLIEVIHDALVEERLLERG